MLAVRGLPLSSRHQDQTSPSGLLAPASPSARDHREPYAVGPHTVNAAHHPSRASSWGRVGNRAFTKLLAP